MSSMQILTYEQQHLTRDFMLYASESSRSRSFFARIRTTDLIFPTGGQDSATEEVIRCVQKKPFMVPNTILAKLNSLQGMKTSGGDGS
jgi:hypothetical protein